MTTEQRIESDLEAIERDEAVLAADVERLERDLKGPVTIEVNRHAVTVEHRLATGLGIKEAAIAAGVNIDTGFHLFKDLSHDRERPVLDSEEIRLHDGEQFSAISPDDNS